MPRMQKTGPICHKRDQTRLNRRSVFLQKDYRRHGVFFIKKCIVVFFTNLAFKVVVLCNLLLVNMTLLHDLNLSVVWCL